MTKWLRQPTDTTEVDAAAAVKDWITTRQRSCRMGQAGKVPVWEGHAGGRTENDLSAAVKWPQRVFERRMFMSLVKRFIQSEDGPTATEYAVMLALIIIVALAAITTLGQKVNSIFTSVNGKLPTG